MPSSLRDSSYRPEQKGDAAAADLVWTVHLAKHEPGKLIVTVLACLVAAYAGYVSFGNPFPVIITLAAVLAAVSDFLLPVTYRIGPNGASNTSLLFRRGIRWEDVKACYMDDCGVKLSPIGVRSSREAFKGVYLRFDGNRDAVVGAVQVLRKSAND